MSSEVAAPVVLPRAPSVTFERIRHALTVAPGIAVHFAVFAVPFVEFTVWSIPAMLFTAYLTGLGVSVG